MSLDDLDVLEVKEAFAVQVLACLDERGVADDDPRLNPRGSGICLGHPLAATGVRVFATLSTNSVISAVGMGWRRCVSAVNRALDDLSACHLWC